MLIFTVLNTMPLIINTRNFPQIGLSNKEVQWFTYNCTCRGKAEWSDIWLVVALCKQGVDA